MIDDDADDDDDNDNGDGDGDDDDDDDGDDDDDDDDDAISVTPWDRVHCPCALCWCKLFSLTVTMRSEDQVHDHLLTTSQWLYPFLPTF